MSEEHTIRTIEKAGSGYHVSFGNGMGVFCPTLSMAEAFMKNECPEFRQEEAQGVFTSWGITASPDGSENNPDDEADKKENIK